MQGKYLPIQTNTSLMNSILNKDLAQTFDDMQNNIDYCPCFIAATDRSSNIPMGKCLCIVYNKNIKKTLSFPNN